MDVSQAVSKVQVEKNLTGWGSRLAIAAKVLLDQNNNVAFDPDGPSILILPTTDPLVAGAIWNDGGIITISAGA
jgi:hypothetical protein